MVATPEFYHTGIGLASFQSGAQNDPTDSLGKWISTTQYTDDTLENIFRSFTLAEMASGTFYHSIGIINTDAEDLIDARVYVNPGTLSLPTGVTFSIGMSSPLDLRTTAMLEIADNSTAPAGVSFTAITSTTNWATGIKLNGGSDDDLSNLDQAQLWVRMVMSSADKFTASENTCGFIIEGS